MRVDFVKIFATIAYLGVLVINYLANALPINDVTPGGVSDSYPNLFAPAGITFSIWGVIYLLLGLFLLYQFGVFGARRDDDLIKKVNYYFILTSIANMLWIFAWHFDYIGVSLILMLTLLFGLIKISNLIFDASKKRFSGKDYFFIRLPFSIYFGWITVATIANIVIFLVSINWNNFGLSNHLWTMIVLGVGALIGLGMALSKKDSAYLVVFIWAYAGILIKHVTVLGAKYSLIITTILFCMTLFVLALGFLLKKYFTINSRI